ncbi:hypothetical protein ACFYNO_21120 [Kitasatospora sp. NPDC006697]|uniref:hypothetical protein n=1 Tax=Kitasatospora sp. NPDC006697 TaxID=3364020 RepID=UPI0036916FCB
MSGIEAAFTADFDPTAGTGSSTGTVTVANPGSQTGTVGTAASLTVGATDSAAGQTLASRPPACPPACRSTPRPA